MKLTQAVLFSAATAVDFDRKVPPRHPLNRLARLQVFADGICHGNANWKPAKQDRIFNRLKGFMDKMEGAFKRDTCGFYNDDINEFPHGGPDPNPEIRLVRRLGQPRREQPSRKRRDANDDIAAMEAACELNDGADLHGDAMEFYQNIYMFQNAAEEEAVDGDQDFYVTEGCTIVEVPVGVRGKGRAIDWANGNKAWKQLTTGIRKWSERYINNCSGMRHGQKQKKRARKIYAEHSDDFTTGQALN